jgi:hypothetical protein
MVSDFSRLGFRVFQSVSGFQEIGFSGFDFSFFSDLDGSDFSVLDLGINSFRFSIGPGYSGFSGSVSFRFRTFGF